MSTSEELNKKLIELIESKQDEETQKAIFEDLIKQGLNINQQDEQFKTPLMKSIQAGNDTITNLLLDNGAQVNLVTDSRYTALKYAVNKEQMTIVERLLNMGAKLNVRDKWYKETPLHVAMKKGNKEIAKLLINSGADYNAVADYSIRGEGKISILDLAQKPGNEDIYDLIMEKEQKKEQERLERRANYIEQLKKETNNTANIETIEAYVDLKMGNNVQIEQLDDKELDDLLQLYHPNKKEVTASQQAEITEQELKNELAKNTKVYIRGVANIADIKTAGEYDIRKHNERGEGTEIRKILRKAGEATATKIRGVKTGNYNRCFTMANYGNITPFLEVGYGVIKENIDDIHLVSKYDAASKIDKEDDMIYKNDLYKDDGENLPIKEALDSVYNHLKNKTREITHNEVVMNVENQDVKFIYWSGEKDITYTKLRAVYFAKKYYEQSGRKLPIYEYKTDAKDYLVETKVTNENIVDMLKEEILDETKKALKPEYNKGGAINFLMAYKDEIGQIENSKEILKTYFEDRLNEYSDKSNITNVWDVINVIKYAGMHAGIIMEGKEDKQMLVEAFKKVFNNILDTDIIMDFLAKSNNGAMHTVGKNKGDNKDMAVLVELLSEIRAVAKDKTMDFLKPDLEEFLKGKMMEVTTDIMLLKTKNGLENGNVDIDKGDKEGKTVLIHAVQKGNERLVKGLLELGADINKVDSDGKSALMYSIEKGSEAMVKLLIEKGVSVENVEINDKMSPEIAQIVKDAKDKQNKELPQSKVLTKQDIMELKENRYNIKSKIQSLKDLTSDTKKVEKSGKNDLINDRRLGKDGVDNLPKSRRNSGMERPM